MSNTRPIRTRFLHRLAREVGAEHVSRLSHNGSRSLVAIGAHAAILMRAGRLDRERRHFTALRRTDLVLLARRRQAAVCFLIPELGEPLVVPVAAVTAHAAPDADPVRVHIRVGARGQAWLVETGRDLRQYAGWARLRRLRPAGPRTAPTPLLSHGQWMTVVGAQGKRGGYDVYVPRADHATLDPILARGSGLIGHCDALPSAAATLESLRYADVVYTRPGDAWPDIVYEVERAGNIKAALGRSAETLEGLRRLGAPTLPRFVLVACATRRAEFERKLRGALHRRAGLDTCCDFRAFADVWADHRAAHPRRRSGSRPTGAADRGA